MWLVSRHFLNGNSSNSNGIDNRLLGEKKKKKIFNFFYSNQLKVEDGSDGKNVNLKCPVAMTRCHVSLK